MSCEIEIVARVFFQMAGTSQRAISLFLTIYSILEPCLPLQTTTGPGIWIALTIFSFISRKHGRETLEIPWHVKF